MHAWQENESFLPSKQGRCIGGEVPCRPSNYHLINGAQEQQADSSIEVNCPTSVATQVSNQTPPSPTKDNNTSVGISPCKPLAKAPPSPGKSDRPAPQPLRLDTSGVNPCNVVGKVLQRIVRSPRHPMITLHFSDSTVFQIHVEGYNPHPSFQGVPKELETDSSFQAILSSCEDGELCLSLAIVDCRFIRLTDKAFEKKNRDNKWDQSHLGLAFKFDGRAGWHCVWATVVEHDDSSQREIFRSYEDVYLQSLSAPISPSKARLPGRQKRRT